MGRGQADEEFDAFVAGSWPRLRWTAYLLTADHHLADDLAQTALVKTYAAWNRVRRDDAFAYARRVLTNANIDRLRRRRFAEVSDEGVETAAACAGTQADDRDQLTRLLAVLSTRERTIVVLRYYCDLPEHVVAHELGLAVGTVKSTASRALAKLRSDLDMPTRGQI